MCPDEQPEVEVVRGIVLPTAWGLEGEARTVGIFTADEGEYSVAPVLAGERLMSHLNDVVEASILLTTGPGCNRSVTVVSFTVVGPAGSEGGADDVGPGCRDGGSSRASTVRPRE